MPRTVAERGKQQRGIETQEALLEAAGRVFARKHYDTARLKDISDEAGISLGSLYFHFGNKDDVARAVLEQQQDRMTEVLTATLTRPGTSLDRLCGLMEGLGNLIANDTLVQAGIRLVSSLPEGLAEVGRSPYSEWVKIADALLREGVKDGSIRSDVDLAAAATFINEVFVGAQVLSGIESAWSSLPGRIRLTQAFVRQLLTN